MSHQTEPTTEIEENSPGEDALSSVAIPSGPIPKIKLTEPEVSVQPKICEYCGTNITEYRQDCAALDDGVCHG